MKILKKILIGLGVVGLIIIASMLIINNNVELMGKSNELKNKFYGKTLNKDFKTKIKSGNLAGDYKIDQVLSDIDSFGLNTINIPILINVKDLGSSDMNVDEASKKKAIELIKKLRWKKVNIILEAYPWIKDGELYETEWKPADIDLFFSNWRSKVLKDLIEDVAVPYHVDALNIASNFVHMEASEASWVDTITYVKRFYKGLITYRTSWWYTAEWDKKTYENFDNKLNNKLYTTVDFISVAAYFELSSKDENTVEELVDNIKSTTAHKRKQNIEQQLKALHDKYNKPIFFGELGFPRRRGAAREPWNPSPTKIIGDGEQANCFEAYRRVFEDKPWHLGFSIFALGENGIDKNYYPSSESAEVIRNWYMK
jgi:hypothetical protein